MGALKRDLEDCSRVLGLERAFIETIGMWGITDAYLFRNRPAGRTHCSALSSPLDSGDDKRTSVQSLQAGRVAGNR